MDKPDEVIYATQGSINSAGMAMPSNTGEMLEWVVQNYTHKLTDEFAGVSMRTIKNGMGYIHPEALLEIAKNIRDSKIDNNEELGEYLTEMSTLPETGIPVTQEPVIDWAEAPEKATACYRDGQTWLYGSYNFLATEDGFHNFDRSYIDENLDEFIFRPKAKRMVETSEEFNADEMYKKMRPDGTYSRKGELLQFISDRMHYKHGEGNKVDYMVALTKLIADEYAIQDKPAQQWVDGLPPIGVYCELEFDISIYSKSAGAIINVSKGSKVEINGTANFGFGDMRIFSGSFNGNWFTSYHKAIAFRPIKSAAEIEATEREADERTAKAKSILKVINDQVFLNADDAWKLAKALATTQLSQSKE